MDIEAVARLIQSGLPEADVQVTGDGSHFEALVVSPAFFGKSPLARQRLVMATVRSQIETGELHAISIKTRTPEQAAQGD
jgi:acid stress-induced BolA-like protein IbaG/YrbA